MNASPPPPPHQPQVPARRPYGSVRLPAVPSVVPPADPVPGARPAPAPWDARRVRLPLLSIDALRSGRRDG